MTDKEIWDYLLYRTKNEYGTAAIMGNLMAESSMNPKNTTGLKKTGYSTVDQYVLASDDGVHDFIHDGVAFGFVQWCYYSRKQGFYNYVKSKNGFIADAKLQLEYLIKEMSESYKSAWAAVVNATDIRSASDVVMLKYEKPGNTSEVMKQRRAAYGQKYYDLYAKGEPQVMGKEVHIIKDKVNIRCGNGLAYSRLGQVSKNTVFQWVATAENGWHAIVYKTQVGWVSGEFSQVKG